MEGVGLKQTKYGHFSGHDIVLELFSNAPHNYPAVSGYRIQYSGHFLAEISDYDGLDGSRGGRNSKSSLGCSFCFFGFFF